jgi:hypothetical protein
MPIEGLKRGNIVVPQTQVRDRLASSARAAGRADQLADLAKRCEAAEYDQQAECMNAALDLIERHDDTRLPSTPVQDHIRACLRAAAFESAAIALIPADAVVTAGRLADGSTVAQVILPGGSGAHSRAARWIGMAVLAAHLRTLAHHTREEPRP